MASHPNSRHRYHPREWWIPAALSNLLIESLQRLRPFDPGWCDDPGIEYYDTRFKRWTYFRGGISGADIVYDYQTTRDQIRPIIKSITKGESLIPLRKLLNDHDDNDGLD